jgi:hypothetical protein
MGSRAKGEPVTGRSFIPSDASAFSEARPGEVSGEEQGAGARVRKSRQKEAAGAADAGLMEIEWSEDRF